MNPSQKKARMVEPLSGFVPEIGRWLWALEDTRQRTEQSLEGIGTAAIDWSPALGGNSIGTLLYHIAAIEVDWLFTDVLQREFPPEVEPLFPYDVRDEQGRLVTVQDVSLEEHLDRLATTRAILLASFRDMDVREFRRLRHMAGYSVTPEWVLHHLMQHEAEHRGQIAELRARAERTLTGSNP
jgi:uncharacterized damage-inducible protein DinB